MEANIEELKNLIKEIRTSENNEYLFWSRNDSYKIYKTIFEENEIKDIKQQCMEYLTYCCDNRIIEDYDLEVSCDDTIQVIQSGAIEYYVNNFFNLNYENDFVPINKDTDFSKFNFIYFAITFNGKELKIFKKFNKPTKVLKQSLQFMFLGEKLKRVTEDIIYVDGQVDAIEYDNKFYIFNRNNFNSIFKFRDIYEKCIDNNQQIVMDSDIFANSQEFIDLCKGNGNYVKRITKAILGKGFEMIQQHKDKLPEVIRGFNLNISTNADGKINCDTGNVKDILNLLLDHYVTSALTDKRAVAKALNYTEDT